MLLVPLQLIIFRKHDFGTGVNFAASWWSLSTQFQFSCFVCHNVYNFCVNVIFWFKTTLNQLEVSRKYMCHFFKTNTTVVKTAIFQESNVKPFQSPLFWLKCTTFLILSGHTSPMWTNYNINVVYFCQNYGLWQALFNIALLKSCRFNYCCFL